MPIACSGETKRWMATRIAVEEPLLLVALSYVEGESADVARTCWCTDATISWGIDCLELGELIRCRPGLSPSLGVVDLFRNHSLVNSWTVARNLQGLVWPACERVRQTTSWLRSQHHFGAHRPDSLGRRLRYRTCSTTYSIHRQWIPGTGGGRSVPFRKGRMRKISSLARLRAAAAAVSTAALLSATFAGAQIVQAATSTCAQQATIAAGDYTIITNEWNSSLQQCITYTSGTAWSVTTANFNTATNGAPATYPAIFKGCHWGNCTANSGLPIQASKLSSATTSWSTTQVSSGFYDVAYDIWFNSTPTTSGQPDGTELMIWLNSYGGVYPFGSQTATASIAGMNWNIWTGQQSSWKIISYILNPGSTSFGNLNVMALIQDAISRGSVNSAHYLIDAEAGFEIWRGGQGLGVNSYSFSAAGGGSATPSPTRPASATATATATASHTASPTATATGTASPTATAVRTASPTATAVRTASPTPSGTGSGSAKCSATYAISSSWGNGFNANVTVNNTGTVATKTWKVPWTWGGNQAITNSWNATVPSSGTAVTATNA